MRVSLLIIQAITEKMKNEKNSLKNMQRGRERQVPLQQHRKRRKEEEINQTQLENTSFISGLKRMENNGYVGMY